MSGENLSLRTTASSSPTISVRTQLLSSFQDHEYRHAFLAEHARAFIALQVRSLREERKITQAQLGELMGKAQAWISRLEDPDYGKVTVATLLELAEAFDTALVIRFAAFSELLDRLVTLSPADYSVASFRDDNFVHDSVIVQVDGTTDYRQLEKLRRKCGTPSAKANSRAAVGSRINTGEIYGIGQTKVDAILAAA